MGIATLSGKQQVAGEALRRFLAARANERKLPDGHDLAGIPAWAGGSPSRRNYDIFRAAQQISREWPSSSFIRNAFGNDWQTALAAIGDKPAIDITSRRLVYSPKA